MLQKALRENGMLGHGIWMERGMLERALRRGLE